MKFWLSSRLSRDWLIEFSWHDGVLETYMVPAFALIHKTPTIVHLKDCVMGGMLMQTDQRARTKVLLFMKPFYLNCQLSCEPGISIVCCFLTGPFQTHNCFKRKLTSAWFFFQLLSQISVFQDNTLFDDCMHPWLHGITWDFSKIPISIHSLDFLISVLLVFQSSDVWYLL